MRKLWTAIFVLSGIALTAQHASAIPVTLVSDTDGTSMKKFDPGQSVTTPSGGPFDEISFNFYDCAMNPAAEGDLFILTQAYTGTPSGLSSSVTGFLAESTGITGGTYTFDPSVTLQGDTQYFFYADLAFDISYSKTSNYAGGNFYKPIFGNFASLPCKDANFLLSGECVGTVTPDVPPSVPEPAGFSLAAFALSILGLFAWKKRSAISH